MKSKILATLGPSSLNKITVEDLTSQGIYLFRLNLSQSEMAVMNNKNIPKIF